MSFIQKIHKSLEGLKNLDFIGEQELIFRPEDVEVVEEKEREVGVVRDGSS